MSHHQRRSTWPSPATRPYRPSLPVGLQCYILYRHRAVVWGFSWSSCLSSSMWRGPQELSLMSSSLHLQPCPACLVRLTWIVFVIGGRWPYSCCFVGCCLQDLSNIARSILVYLPSSFFSICLVSVHVMHPYSIINMTASWKKLLFIISVRSDFHMTDRVSIAVHAIACRVFMSVSVDETLLSR